MTRPGWATGGVWHLSLCPRQYDSQDRAGQPLPGLRVTVSLPLPARETVEPVGSVKPAGFHTSAAREGSLRGLDKADAAPPGPSRPPHPRGTKIAGSHRSSLTSLEGSGISEQLPQKSLHQAGGPHPEVSMHLGWDLLESSGPQPLLTPFQNACCSQSLPVRVLPNIQGLCPVPPLAVTPPTPVPLPGALACPLRACGPLSAFL